MHLKQIFYSIQILPQEGSTGEWFEVKNGSGQMV